FKKTEKNEESEYHDLDHGRIQVILIKNLQEHFFLVVIGLSYQFHTEGRAQVSIHTPCHSPHVNTLEEFPVLHFIKNVFGKRITGVFIRSDGAEHARNVLVGAKKINNRKRND